VIVQKLFELVTQPLGLVNAPLWAAYADAHARRDATFIRVTLRRSLVGTALIASILCFLILLIGPELVNVWLGSKIAIPRDFLAAYGFWIVVSTTGSALAMYLNGVGIVREQVALAIPFIVASAVVKIWAVSQWGLMGLPVATIAVYVTVIVIPYLTFFRERILSPSQNDPGLPTASSSR
jgi:O-antigen/teichoic acid export membrane protein